MAMELTSLTLCRLHLRKGDLQLALMAAYETMEDADLLSSSEQWLEGARYAINCYQELNSLEKSQETIHKVFQFVKTETEERLIASAECLIGSWLLANGKNTEAQTYILSAIEKSSSSQDLKVLSRALLLMGLLNCLDQARHSEALKYFAKLELILRQQPNDEVSLTALTLRGYIHTQAKDFQKAREILLEAYQTARAHGFHMLESSILAQLARLYRDQNRQEQYRLYSELALSGVDPTKWPRLHQLISASCSQALKEKTPWDFEVDEIARTIREKSKGVLDFKNQHIIYDLTLLFLKNPGVRFSKEDLAQKIWGQVYNPEQHANIVYVSIKRLRTLLEPDLESPQYILRDRKGYYLNPQASVKFSTAFTQEVDYV